MGLGFRVYGLGFRVSGFGFRVYGSGSGREGGRERGRKRKGGGGGPCLDARRKQAAAGREREREREGAVAGRAARGDLCQGSGLRVLDLGYRVLGFLHGSGFRVWGQSLRL